jgi:FKBP-type peptidyl-prolyl cis-trans isomerase
MQKYFSIFILLNIKIWVNLDAQGKMVTDHWENGKVKHEGNQNGDCRYGVHKWYFENGQKKAEVTYQENCVPLKCLTWDERGDIMDEVTFAYRENIFSQLKNISFDSSEAGIGFKIISPGTGPRPSEGRKVVVRYTGALQDGSVFDGEGGGANIKFRMGNHEVIKGFEAGTAMIAEGGSLWVRIPYPLAYGVDLVGNIPPGSTLIYKIELVDVNEK